MRRGGSQTIGVLVPDLENETFINVIRAFMASLNAGQSKPATPLIAETLDRQGAAGQLIETFLSHRVDAIISLASSETDKSILEDAARNVPVVLAIRSLAALSLPSALCDDHIGGPIVAGHFAERGHKVVCQVQGPALATTFNNRATGFTRVCAEKGMHEISQAIYTEQATSSAGREAFDAVLAASPRPTAIFAHSDAIALGPIEAIRLHGLCIPEDMALVGFNDIRIAQVLATPLTTVAYPVAAVDDYAGVLVKRLIAGDSPAESRSFAPELVIRRTT